MGSLGAALRLYGELALESLRLLPRSGLAALALFLGSVLLGWASLLLAPLGILGGFVLALVEAGVAGTYLFLLELVVVQRRRLRGSDIRDGLGRYLWDVISVLFLFWLLSLLLRPFAGTPVPLGVELVVFVLFNPAPELVYQGSSRSVALLADAARFVFDHWPEWFGPQLLLGAALALCVPKPFAGLQALGPSFGFVQVAQWWWSPLLGGPWHPVSALMGLLALLIVHLALLFRGLLFRELRRGGLRARAWRARLR